ncbi:unnamed protein product, partial [Vitis vinifera]|uniref:Uncharacterized protein n=1 Tax=Vitis vinifera TaxID=29760 RepID=D7TF57_VITVI
MQSGSHRSPTPPPPAASLAFLATIYSSSQSFPTIYQTGMGCPHHSCLLIHQSLIFDSQCCKSKQKKFRHNG